MPEKVVLDQCYEKKSQDRRPKCATCHAEQSRSSPNFREHSGSNTEAHIPTSSTTVSATTLNPDNQDGRPNSSPATVRTRQQSLDMIQFTGAPSPGFLLDPEYGYVIPENFSMVWKGVYRSSFPKEESFEFVRRLGLKSILTLFPEEYPSKNLKFMEEAGITHFQIGMPGNKEPFVNIPKEGVADALRAVLDRRNHPTLIHCNKGKVHPPSKIQGAATKQLNPTVPLTLQLNMQHRTGCVVGCLRKIQQWGLTLIFDEYRRHSHPKSRALDQQFIELFDHSDLIELARENGWLPERYPKSTSDARVEAPGPMSS